MSDRSANAVKQLPAVESVSAVGIERLHVRSEFLSKIFWKKRDCSTSPIGPKIRKVQEAQTIFMRILFVEKKE